MILWILTTLAILLMAWALAIEHNIIKVRSGDAGDMGKGLAIAAIGGLSFLIAVVTLLAALILQRWGVAVATLLPGVMALISWRITVERRRVANLPKWIVIHPDDAIRKQIVDLLRRQDPKKPIYDAATADDAMDRWYAFSGRVHLLIIDAAEALVARGWQKKSMVAFVHTSMLDCPLLIVGDPAAAERVRQIVAGPDSKSPDVHVLGSIDEITRHTTVASRPGDR